MCVAENAVHTDLRTGKTISLSEKLEQERKEKEAKDGVVKTLIEKYYAFLDKPGDNNWHYCKQRYYELMDMLAALEKYARSTAKDLQASCKKYGLTEAEFIAYTIIAHGLGRTFEDLQRHRWAKRVRYRQACKNHYFCPMVRPDGMDCQKINPNEENHVVCRYVPSCSNCLYVAWYNTGEMSCKKFKGKDDKVGRCMVCNRHKLNTGCNNGKAHYFRYIGKCMMCNKPIMPNNKLCYFYCSKCEKETERQMNKVFRGKA